MYELKFHTAVKKDLRHIPHATVEKIYEAWKELASNPFLGYKLKGKYAGQMAYDFSYRYRIIYQLDEPKRSMIILEVWHRSWDYRRR